MSETSEFAYELKFRLGPYKIFWIHDRHRHLVQSKGWKKLWIEKKNKDKSWSIVYGLNTSKE